LLTIAQSSSQRLVRLVNDILDVEKIEAQQITFNFIPVSARMLAQRAVEANRGFADGCGVQVRLDPTSTVCEVHADPDRLSQVVTNLLSNATKFSPRDSEVSVAIRQRGGAVRISVRDHGRGIPADFKPHIFEKFAQADATNAGRKGGTGLGLSIAKQIMTRHGGTIGFEDAPGGGTVFHLDLPSRDQVTARAIDPVGTPGAPRILLCADDPNKTVALRKGLHFAFVTDFAHIRADAIARAATTAYGAIVIDLELPAGDNIALIRELSRQPHNGSTPIIVLSANPDSRSNVMSSFEPGKLAWLDKPVDIERLAQVLDRVVIRS
jgi:CheY-like chemotaxis protein